MPTAPTARVRVPATSANLGPGFDSLGLALGLYDEVEATITDGPTVTGGPMAPSGATITDGARGTEAGAVNGGAVRVAVSGEGAGTLPADERHLVVRAMYATFDAIGERPAGLALSCVNRIPHARGLGSSSAAIVAGVLLARALSTGGDRYLDDAAVLRLAASLEGHPDNVAPCLLGGFTIAWTDPDGAHAVRLEPAETIQPVVFVPAGRGLTAEARAVLPERVPHTDAATTAGRAALLVHALTAAPDLLYPATEDRLHQDYRASAMPATAALVKHLRAAGVPAVVSGAGPSVLALVPAGQDLSGLAGPEVAPHALEIARKGAYVM